MQECLRKTLMNYLDDDEFIKEFIEHYGEENIPNPDQYPHRFKFLLKSFAHYKKMREIKVS